MHAHDQFDQAYEKTRMHIADLLAEAARERFARAIRPAPMLPATIGALLMALGAALVRAGERLAGQAAAPGIRG
ncbi:MAG TPA: hypothetical protein VNL71_05195 [Chloroflexota bacterium]|nr:hypothetical protein [Chloroflexota bacterium]